MKNQEWCTFKSLKTPNVDRLLSGSIFESFAINVEQNPALLLLEMSRAINNVWSKNVKADEFQHASLDRAEDAIDVAVESARQIGFKRTACSE